MQRSAQGANTRSKKTRQQNTRSRPSSNQQDTNMGAINGSVSPLALPPMITEYQERFLPPQWYGTYTTTSRMKDPSHPLRGTNADIGILRTSFAVQKWRKTPLQPPHPPQPAEPAEPAEPLKDYRRKASSATRPALRIIAPRTPPKQDFVTVYQSDFKPWELNKLKPYRLKDNFNIKYGIVALDQQQGQTSTANGAGVPQEVSHHVQPRPGHVKPPEPAAASFQPKAASHINRERLDESGDFFDKFQSWSLETKFCGQSGCHRFVQMTHKSNGTTPILPSVQTSMSSAEPVHGYTMKEDFRAWTAPQVAKNLRADVPK